MEKVRVLALIGFSVVEAGIIASEGEELEISRLLALDLELLGFVQRM